MKKLHLFKRTLLLLALIVGCVSAWGQVTIWSEDFSGYSADAVPSGTISLPHTGTSLNASGTLTYACTNGTYTEKGKQKTSSTKIYNEEVATGTSPELMVARTTGGSFTATIPLDNIEGTLTLTYYQNKQSLKVSSPTKGVSGGQTLKPSDAGQQTTTFTGITADMTSITIVFETTTTSNVRLDNIVLTGYKAEVPITSIAFSEPKTASVGVGGTTTLTPTILPANYNEAIDWESDATDVATVSSAGVVTGKAAGTAHIKAKAHDNPSTIYDVCTVTVTAAIPVTGVSLKSSTTLLLGGTETLEATVSPNDATNKNVTWSSADDTKVSVDEDGFITGLALTGDTPVTITVTTEDGGFTATCNVTVNPVPVSSVGLDKTSATLRISKTLQLAATVSPDNATDKSVTWESDDTDIATVTSAGLVTAKAVGSATITVKSNADNTKKATCTITVTDGAISLSPGDAITFSDFSGAGTGGYKTQKCDLTASDDNDYEWSETRAYSNSGWQLEASTGNVTSPAIKTTYGFAITATMTNNSVVISDGTNEGTNTLTTSKTNTTITISSTSKYAKISSITITALKPSRSVTFPDGNQEITVDGSTITKTATVSPAGTATYTSSDTDVATVNATTGEVTAVKGGSAVITATVAADEDYEKSTGSYTVTVNKAATTLAFAEDEITVELVDGTDAGQTATASPSDGTRVITYSTEADGATVNSSTGALTFTKTGDFTIKANATATDKYEAPSEASYTLHVQDSRVPIVDASKLTLGLTDDEDNPIALNGVQKDDTGTLAASYTTATGFSGTEEVTYTSSDDDVLLIDDNEFAALKGGVVTVTVTITSGGDKMFTTVEKEFTVTVTNPSKTATEITVLDANTDPVVDGDVLNLTYGTPVALDVDITSGYEGTISKVLGNSSIVGITTDGTTVTITPAAIGSTTLTFSAAETANYQAAANIAVTINVAAPTAQTSTGTVDGTVEDLDFSKYYVPETWTVTTTNVNEYQAWTDNESNDFISANGYKNSTRYAGTYDYITDEYDLTRYSTANLEFEHAGQYFNTISDGVKLFAEVDGEEQKLTINTYFEGTSYNEYVKNTTSIDALCGKKAKIIFRYISDGASTNTGRWDIKSFKISGQTLPSEAITVASSGFSTYCYQYPLDLDLLDEDVKAYIVTDVSDNDVTFKRVTGTIKGGVPFILYGTAGAHTLYTAASSTNVPEGNMLVGTLAPKFITAKEGDYTNFGLYNGKFVKATDGVIGANKAYLPILTSSIGSGAHEFNIIFDEGETTAISEVRGLKSDVRGEFYNLNGQRVATPVKGNIYIVNGKKVMFK